MKNPTRGWKITLEFITGYWLLHYFAGCKFTTYESYLLTIEISQADKINSLSWITKKSKLFKSIKICVGLLVFDYSESSHSIKCLAYFQSIMAWYMYTDCEACCQGSKTDKHEVMFGSIAIAVKLGNFSLQSSLLLMYSVFESRQILQAVKFLDNMQSGVISGTM